jgi:endoglucanase
MNQSIRSGRARAALVLASAAAYLGCGAASASAATTVREGESLSLAASAGMTFSDGAASGGRALLIWSNATASGSLSTTAARRLVVRARGDQCGGAPRMSVAVDGRTVLDVAVSASAWTDYGADVGLANGAHTLAISFTNDAAGAGGCDRNLRVDRVTVGSTAGWPFAGRRFHVEPDGDARRQADAWRATRPADAAQMDKIAAQPQAAWFGGWHADVGAAVRAHVDAAQAAGAVPALVAYNIPQRDCGQYSAGGAGSADAYRAWICGFAAGIGNRAAAVVLEPDALAGVDCLGAADRTRRLGLLRDAVAVLTAQPAVSVYLDGGHARWHPAAETAARLRDAGVADAQGFALNVSNFVSSAESAAYGSQVAAATGGKHFVVDTSRNGLGPAPDGDWCNPPGRALGLRPGSVTGVSRQDANLWVKRPGQSDGPCHGGPPAGAWWADYALGLAQRAAY